MKSRPSIRSFVSNQSVEILSLVLFHAFLSLAGGLAAAQDQPVTVTVADTGSGADLPPGFLGLSYESSMLLPQNGSYYFERNHESLVRTFQTLGIKSLRVGANAVDDPRVAVPQEKDIDALFDFARAAGVKVIYSFRLKQGDPAESARLAAYIAAHDADALDCFAIGNEPDSYFKSYAAFLAQWRPHYSAILQAVPKARFDGPSESGNQYALPLARDIFPSGHLAMASNHYYFFGNGRDGEKDPAKMRARFLSSDVDKNYERDFDQVGAVLAAEGVPYRIDELNNCFGGGARSSSDTFAAALWALDCTHWWAAHHILGLNYHTGHYFSKEMGGVAGFNYAAFVSLPGNEGFVMRPPAYGFLAFTQGAHGRSLAVTTQAPPTFDFTAYAYRDHDGSLYLTLINKSYGDHAQAATVSLSLPPGIEAGNWESMDLTQKDRDVAAKTGLTLGESAIDAQGNWSGKWSEIKKPAQGALTLSVPATSAKILRLSPPAEPAKGP